MTEHEYLTIDATGVTAHLYLREEVVAASVDFNGITDEPVAALCNQVSAIGVFEEYDPEEDEAATAGRRCRNCLDVARARAADADDDELANRFLELREVTRHG